MLSCNPPVLQGAGEANREEVALRDVEELLEERGLEADHTTVWRVVQRYRPEREPRMRRYLQPTNKSGRADETYIRVKGRWCYLYRAIDSAGATIDFLLSTLRDADAAKRLLRKALSDRCHPQPRVINKDLAPTYGAAIANIKKEGTLQNRCRHRPVQYFKFASPPARLDAAGDHWWWTETRSLNSMKAA
jgi:transposase-like protein